MNGFFLYGASTIINTVVGLLAIRILNQKLAISEIGSFFLFQALYELIIPLISISSYTLFTRYSHESSTAIIKSIIKPYIFISIIAHIFINIIFELPRGFIFLYVIVIFNHVIYWSRGKSQPLIFFVLTFLQKISYLSFIFYGDISIDNIFIFISISYMVALLVPVKSLLNVRYAHEESLRQAIVDSNKIIKYLIGTSVVGLISWLSIFSEKYILDYYFSNEIVSSYMVNYKLVNILTIINSVFLLIFPQYYFSQIQSNYKKVILIRNFIFIVLLLVCYCIYAYSDLIFTLFKAEKYYVDRYLILCFLLSEFLRLTSSYYFIYSTFSYEQTSYALILLITAITNILLGLYLIPKLGILGAVFSSIGANLALFLFSLLARKNEHYKLG